MNPDLRDLCATCAVSGFIAATGVAIALLGWIGIDNPLYAVGGTLVACAGGLFGWLSYEDATTT